MKHQFTCSTIQKPAQAQSTGTSNPSRALTSKEQVSIPDPPNIVSTPELCSNEVMNQAMQQYQALMIQQMASWSSMLQLQQQYVNGDFKPMILNHPTWGSNFAVNSHRPVRGRGRGKGRNITWKNESLSHSLSGSNTRGSVMRMKTTLGRGSVLKKVSKTTGRRIQHLKCTRPPSLEKELFAKR